MAGIFNQAFGGGLQNSKRLIDLVQNRQDRNTLQNVAELARQGDFNNAGSRLMEIGLVGPGSRLINLPYQREQDAQKSKLAQLAFDANQAYRNSQLGLQRQRLSQADRHHNERQSNQNRVTYGKSPSYHMVDGVVRFGVFGSDGSFKSFDNVEPATKLMKIDTGLNTELVNQRTGQAVRNVDKNVKGEAFDKKAGAIQAETQTKAQIDLPQVEDSSRYMLDAINNVINTPDMDDYLGNIEGRLPDALSQGRQDFANRLKLVKSKQFAIAFESLKGAGQITEYESKSAADAQAVLETTSSGPEFRTALNTLAGVVRDLTARARNKANGTKRTLSDAELDQLYGD